MVLPYLDLIPVSLFPCLIPDPEPPPQAVEDAVERFFSTRLE